MSQTKGTRKEIIEIDARLNELERARPYLKGDFYYTRTQTLRERKDKLEKKFENGTLAPDIQYILTEVYDEN